MRSRLAQALLGAQAAQGGIRAQSPMLPPKLPPDEVGQTRTGDYKMEALAGESMMDQKFAG